MAKGLDWEKAKSPIRHEEWEGALIKNRTFTAQYDGICRRCHEPHIQPGDKIIHIGNGWEKVGCVPPNIQVRKI